MRFKKLKLIAPITPLKTNSAENCHACGSSPSVNAATRKVMKLAQFAQAASRNKYFPRNAGGTSPVIHGSHAQLEMPRDRLKQNSSDRTSTSRVFASRNFPVNGTSAIPKMNKTRVPQPA